MNRNSYRSCSNIYGPGCIYAIPNNNPIFGGIWFNGINNLVTASQSLTFTNNILTVNGGVDGNYITLNPQYQNPNPYKQGTLWVDSTDTVYIDNQQIANMNIVEPQIVALQTGKQNVITGAASTITNSNLTPSIVAVSDSSGKLVSSSTSTTALSYISTLTSNVQDQINSITGEVTLNPNSVVITNSSGNLKSSTTNASELSYLDATSSIQGQFNTLDTNVGSLTTIVTSNTNSINTLTGQVTINTTDISNNTAELNAATSNNTASTLVLRDSSGNFSAGTITANLTGNATTATSSVSFSGSLSGDVTGVQSATVVNSVGGSSAYAVNTATILANDATSANTAGTLVLRDSSGNFSTTMITLSGTPTNSTDAATKSYVDTSISLGIVVKTPAQVIATSDTALTGLYTIDSYTLNSGDRVLVIAQTSSIDNGIYVAASGSWSLSTDFSSGNEAGQAYVLILMGNNYAGSSWLCNTPTAIIGTDVITFTQFSLPSQTTGNNVGVGTGQVYASKIGETLNFKTVLSGSHIVVTNNTNEVQVATDGTNLNTVSTLVSRDANGDFSAGTITASLIGHASLDLPLTGGTISGTLNISSLSASSLVTTDASDNLISQSGLTSGTHIIATGTGSIGNSSSMTESSGNVTITPVTDGNVLTITNHANTLNILQVNTSTPSVTINAYTTIPAPLQVQPSTGAASAFYVQDPSNNYVLNVKTSGNGEVGIGGVDDTNKFSVQTSTGADIFNVDTVNQQVFIQTPTNSNRALAIQDSAGNEVLYVATASYGVVAVGGVDAYTKLGVYTSAGASIFIVDTATPAIRVNANIVFPTYGTGNYFDQYGNMNFKGATLTSSSYWSVTDFAGGQPFRVYPSSTSTSAPTTQVEMIPTTASTNTLMVYDNASNPSLTVGSNGGVEVSGANNYNKFYVQTASDVIIFNVDTLSDQVMMNAAVTINGTNNANKFYIGNASSTTIFNVDTLTPGISMNVDTTVTGNLTVNGSGTVDISGSNTTQGTVTVMGGNDSTTPLTTNITNVLGGGSNGGTLDLYGGQSSTTSNNQINIGSSTYPQNIGISGSILYNINNAANGGSGYVSMPAVTRWYYTNTISVGWFFYLPTNISYNQVISINGGFYVAGDGFYPLGYAENPAYIANARASSQGFIGIQTGSSWGQSSYTVTWYIWFDTI